MRSGRPFISVAVLLVLGSASAVAAPRTLTFEERVAAQRKIEEVYWRHRIWPKENANPKPSLAFSVPDATVRAKVRDTIAKSVALERLWHRPITADQLQAELDRMARSTRDPRLLQELFDVLGDDALLVAETLGRRALADRLARNAYANDPGPNPEFDTWWRCQAIKLSTLEPTPVQDSLVLPLLENTSCTNDTWTPTKGSVPDITRDGSVVWTGTEMIVWGGSTHLQNRGGGRYDPATDTWTPTSIGSNVPLSRADHTAVWTGTEMIVWGGWNIVPGTSNPANPPQTQSLATGARYNPVTDTWVPTSTGPGTPQARAGHSAVWTGQEMIIWGGGGCEGLDTGGRYNPTTDTWTPTSTGPGVPSPRSEHTAVWTGTEMIVWGGSQCFAPITTGARYDPFTNSWTPTSNVDVPRATSGHTAVWTGTEMIVWGGDYFVDGTQQWANTGGRYNPATDSWISTSLGPDVPLARTDHGAVWTGTEMIVWGGMTSQLDFTATGGRYNPTNDTWTPTSTGLHTPLPRTLPYAVWTGSEMIIWGGGAQAIPYDGGRYDPKGDSWTPTSRGDEVPTPRFLHTTVWTGAEMIVWGGWDIANVELNTGGFYDPATDTWTPTPIGPDTPEPRSGHDAVWTGTEMIIWGSHGAGARFNPATLVWTPMSTVAAPVPRTAAPAVWTGTEMIVWGGIADSGTRLGTGGRYRPLTDSWTPTTNVGAPVARGSHVAVWTGTEMIVWGGAVTASQVTNTGARYRPSTDSWTPTSLGTGVPAARRWSTAVWTGAEMIVWGGGNAEIDMNSGGRYNPSTDSWASTSTANAPFPRSAHAAAWTGAEMLIWGGVGFIPPAGGRYRVSGNTWTPMATESAPATGDATSVWTGSEMIVWGGHMTSTGGRYCACANGIFIYRDADGDGYGDPAFPSPSCDGTTPPGNVANAGDCDDAASARHPGAAEVCNAVDDDCDGVVDGGDADGDALATACDNCPGIPNRNQSDVDADAQGDACDLDDGLIYFLNAPDRDTLLWQAEQGFTSWNVYRGDLQVLRATGVYSQIPGSNPLADRFCGLGSTQLLDATTPSSGGVGFQLVTGVSGGVESGLGDARPNAHPCP